MLYQVKHSLWHRSTTQSTLARSWKRVYIMLKFINALRLLDADKRALQLTPSTCAFLQKRSVLQPHKNLPTLNGTRRFIAVFATVSTGAYPKPDQSGQSHLILSLQHYL
jgi:hypothetical protein